MTTGELLEAARIIELQPDDVLVVVIPRVVTAMQASSVKEHLREFTDRKVLVLGDGAELLILRDTPDTGDRTVSAESNGIGKWTGAAAAYRRGVT